ncbi:MAG: hypothetical protein P8X82_12615 [Gemmatimonadales bacterium]
MKSILTGVLSPTIVALIGFGWQAQATDITGTWQADTPDGPQTVIVRADSSASFGDETVTGESLPTRYSYSSATSGWGTTSSSMVIC